MIVRKRKKWQNKRPSEMLTQLITFFNSDATWVKIPYDSERFKTVDSMRATYVNAMIYYGLPKVKVKTYCDHIQITRIKK